MTTPTFEPGDWYPALCDAYNAGDLERVIALYDPDAVYVKKPGMVTQGPQELRQVLAGIVALRGEIAISLETMVRGSDIALATGTFTLKGRRGDGSPFERSSRFVDVLRRQSDGRWLVAIDNPHGLAIAS